MKKIVRNIYQYTAIFEPDEKTIGCTVTIHSLPGCISEGDSFEKALENIKEAANLYLEVIKEQTNKISQERGESIPIDNVPSNGFSLLT